MPWNCAPTHVPSKSYAPFRIRGGMLMSRRHSANVGGKVPPPLSLSAFSIGAGHPKQRKPRSPPQVDVASHDRRALAFQQQRPGMRSVTVYLLTLCM